MEVRAAAYRSSAVATYDQAFREANFAIAAAGFTPPGTTPEERAALVAYAKMSAAYDVMVTIDGHFTWMNANPPARCFADAYQADVQTGQAIVAAAEAIMDSEGKGDLMGVWPTAQTFVADLPEYFSDCG